MNIFFSIDDTDNLDSPGSGHLLEALAEILQIRGLVSQCTGISRHQLLIHPAVPFTSHNSSMCIAAEIDKDSFGDIVEVSGQFIKDRSAPGSDPGFCLAAGKDLAAKELIAFGLKAKQEICSKAEAYALAKKTGIHLSEHGGSGQGVVGALAAIGLRLHGSDGRYRGWLKLGKAGETATSDYLCKHPLVDAVVDEEGFAIPEGSRLVFAEDRIKTVCLNHQQVIPVTRTGNTAGPAWITLTGSAAKRF